MDYNNDIRLQSRFFAEIKQGKAINDMVDMTIYVKNNGQEWADAVSQIGRYKMRLMADSLVQDIEHQGLMQRDENLLMPVLSVEKEEKLYIVGTIKNSTMLQAAAEMINGDAEKIVSVLTSECTLANNSEERGARTPSPVAYMGKEEAEAYRDAKSNMKYQEMQNLKLSLVQIAKRMRSKDLKIKKVAEKEFAQVIAVLSEKEKSQVIMTLLMHTGTQADLGEALRRVLDRDYMGQTTQCNVEARLIKNLGKVRFYFRKGADVEREMQLSPNAATIYALNLAQAKKGEFRVYDLNEKEYRNVYEIVAGKPFEEKFDHIKSDIKDFYNEIENKLAEIFNYLDEDYSPFLVNNCTPIVVNRDRIAVSKYVCDKMK